MMLIAAEDADKANQALKDAVAELMENEIRGLIIGEPNFAGIVGKQCRVYTVFRSPRCHSNDGRYALPSTAVKKHFLTTAGRSLPTSADLSGAACSGRDPG